MSASAVFPFDPGRVRAASDDDALPNCTVLEIPAPNGLSTQTFEVCAP